MLSRVTGFTGSHFLEDMPAIRVPISYLSTISWGSSISPASLLLFFSTGTESVFFRLHKLMDELFPCKYVCTHSLLQLRNLISAFNIVSGACEGSLACSTCHVIVMVCFGSTYYRKCVSGISCV